MPRKLVLLSFFFILLQLYGQTTLTLNGKVVLDINDHILTAEHVSISVASKVVNGGSIHVSRNFDILGEIVSKENSLVALVGSEKQNLYSLTPLEVTNLLLLNPKGYDYTSTHLFPIIVNGLLNLSYGQLAIPNTSLIFNSTATVSQSEGSFVSGNIIWHGNSSIDQDNFNHFLFPTGYINNAQENVSVPLYLNNLDDNDTVEVHYEHILDGEHIARANTLTNRKDHEEIYHNTSSSKAIIDTQNFWYVQSFSPLSENYVRLSKQPDSYDTIIAWDYASSSDWKDLGNDINVSNGTTISSLYPLPETKELLITFGRINDDIATVSSDQLALNNTWFINGLEAVEKYSISLFTVNGTGIVQNMTDGYNPNVGLKIPPEYSGNCYYVISYTTLDGISNVKKGFIRLIN